MVNLGSRTLYGKWKCADGREVLFDRFYDPICDRRPGRGVQVANPDEWVHGIIEQSYFWDDWDSPKERQAKADAIWTEWGMSDPGPSASDELPQLTRLVDAVEHQGFRRGWRTGTVEGYSRGFAEGREAGRRLGLLEAADKERGQRRGSRG